MHRPGPIETTLHASLAGLVMVLSSPVIYRRLARGLRDVLRFTTGLYAAGFVIAGVVCGSMAAAAGVVVFAIAYAVHARSRSRLKLHACDRCDELDAGGICSGYARQAECARAFERDASELVMSRMRGPGCQRARGANV